MTTALEPTGGDLSITALYTAQAWAWGKLEGAELFKSWKGRDVFNATNLALGTARLFRRDVPSLRHGLVQRHVMIDRLVEAAGCAQVLELAAGLSRRGAAMSKDERVRYVEVDLPAMIAHKRRLLARSKRGRELATRANWILHGADVTTVALDELLDDGPVCVIAEGLLMYLAPDEQRALWAKLAALCQARPGSIAIFDLVPFVEQPKPGRVGRALERIFKRATRGRTMAQDDRTRDALTGELRAAGFTTVETFEPSTAPAAWKLPFTRTRTQQLVWRVSV